ncbi:MAG TPA: hypothetical protein VHO84_13315 [Syntrophorhabdaceae bacterium]|nr:hypothetical protein [Syntrophorhabdaceae bacterium]
MSRRVRTFEFDRSTNDLDEKRYELIVVFVTDSRDYLLYQINME